MKPLVSVIIPVFNTALYLERCICSVLSSSYRDIEVLAIDDGSTDGSGKILDRLSEDDSIAFPEDRFTAGMPVVHDMAGVPLMDEYSEDIVDINENEIAADAE